MSDTFKIVDNVGVIGARPIENSFAEMGRGPHGAHPQITCEFANGYRLSIVWGMHTYSDNRAAFATETPTAEVAILRPDGKFAPLPDWEDDVLGYVTTEEAWEIYKRVEAL